MLNSKMVKNNNFNIVLNSIDIYTSVLVKHIGGEFAFFMGKEIYDGIEMEKVKIFLFQKVNEEFIKLSKLTNKLKLAN